MLLDELFHCFKDLVAVMTEAHGLDLIVSDEAALASELSIFLFVSLVCSLVVVLEGWYFIFVLAKSELIDELNLTFGQRNSSSIAFGRILCESDHYNNWWEDTFLLLGFHFQGRLSYFQYSFEVHRWRFSILDDDHDVHHLNSTCRSCCSCRADFC